MAFIAKYKQTEAKQCCIEVVFFRLQTFLEICLQRPAFGNGVADEHTALVMTEHCFCYKVVSINQIQNVFLSTRIGQWTTLFYTICFLKTHPIMRHIFGKHRLRKYIKC